MPPLMLVGLDVFGLAAGYAEALVEQDEIHAFDEAFGSVSGCAWRGARYRVASNRSRNVARRNRRRTGDPKRVGKATIPFLSLYSLGPHKSWRPQLT